MMLDSMIDADQAKRKGEWRILQKHLSMRDEQYLWEKMWAEAGGRTASVARENRRQPVSKRWAFGAFFRKEAA